MVTCGISSNHRGRVNDDVAIALDEMEMGKTAHLTFDLFPPPYVVVYSSMICLRRTGAHRLAYWVFGVTSR